MSQLVDSDAQRLVTQLVEKLTDKRKFALDPELAKDVKRLCKASDESVRAAFDAISEQLKTTHAQVTPSPPSSQSTSRFEPVRFQPLGLSAHSRGTFDSGCTRTFTAFAAGAAHEHMRYNSSVLVSIRHSKTPDRNPSPGA